MAPTARNVWRLAHRAFRLCGRGETSTYLAHLMLRDARYLAFVALTPSAAERLITHAHEITA